MAISDKLTYLNTTKTKIREGLNSLGADLDTEDTFRSYADAIEGIYEDYPKITGEGESLSLDNTKQASMQIDYKGNTNQTGTPTPSSPIPVNVVSGDNYINICGKNLLPTSDIIGTSGTTSNGITFTRNSDGSITANGTATGGISIYINADYTELPAGTYTFSDSVPSGGSGTTFFLYADVKHIDGTSWDIKNFSTAETTTRTRTMGEPFIFKTRIVIRNGQTLNNVVFKPMLENRTTATTYEPYIGNSYPIYLGVLGKNLFDGIIESGGFDSNGLNVAMNSRLRSKDYVRVKPNTTYTISTTNNDSSRTLQISISKYAVNNYTTPRISYVNWTNLPVTFTTDSNCNFIRLLYKYTNETTMQVSNISNEQVELGNGATIYEKYNPLELCKIGTYQDYIYKDNGNWYLHKEIGKVVLNGNETLEFYSNNLIYKEDNIRNYNAGGLVYCNYYLGTANGGSANVNLNAWNGNAHNINIKNNSIANLNDFKTWLSTHNTIVYYVLATPTNTEITDTTLIEQLEESKLSYVSQTNISQENNDLPFNLDVKALRGE